MASYRTIVRNAFDRIIEARMRQAERQIGLHNRNLAGWDGVVKGQKHS